MSSWSSDYDVAETTFISHFSLLISHSINSQFVTILTLNKTKERIENEQLRNTQKAQ